MEATLNNTEEALNKKGVIIDRWILRLGKSDEEAGKFTPWFLPSNTLKEDYAAFLACLNLTRLVDSVEERMKGQKTTIRAVKKEQRETAKALAKEQEKLQKALDKAAAKIAKEAEKVRVKAEAKAERERLKAEKKMGATHRVEVEQTVNLPLQESNAGSIPAAPTIAKEEACTSTSKMGQTVMLLDSIPHVVVTSSSSPDTPAPETPQPVVTISTEVLVLSKADTKVFVEALLNPPEPNAVLKHASEKYKSMSLTMETIQEKK
jgi:hypothetical protein